MPQPTLTKTKTKINQSVLVWIGLVVAVGLLGFFAMNVAIVSISLVSPATLPSGGIYTNNFESGVSGILTYNASIFSRYDLYRARSGYYVAEVDISGSQGGVYKHFLVGPQLQTGATYTLSAYLRERDKKEEFGRLHTRIRFSNGQIIDGNNIAENSWTIWSKSEVSFTVPSGVSYVDVYFGYGIEGDGEFYRGKFWIDDVLLIQTSEPPGPRLEVNLQPIPHSGTIAVGSGNWNVGTIVFDAAGSNEDIQVNGLNFFIETINPAKPTNISNYSLGEGSNNFWYAQNPISSAPGSSEVIAFYFPFNSLVIPMNQARYLTLRVNVDHDWPEAGIYTISVGTVAANGVSSNQMVGALVSSNKGVSLATSGSSSSGSGSNSTNFGPGGGCSTNRDWPPGDLSCDSGQVLHWPAEVLGKLQCRNFYWNEQGPEDERFTYCFEDLGRMCGIVGCDCTFVISDSGHEEDNETDWQWFIEGSIKVDDSKPNNCVAIPGRGTNPMTGVQEDIWTCTPYNSKNNEGCCASTRNADGTRSGIVYNTNTQLCCDPGRDTDVETAYVIPRCNPPATSCPAVNSRITVGLPLSDGCCPYTPPPPGGTPSNIDNFISRLVNDPDCRARINATQTACHEGPDSSHNNGCAVDLDNVSNCEAVTQGLANGTCQTKSTHIHCGICP